MRVVWRSPLDEIEIWKAHLLWRPDSMGFVSVTRDEIAASSLRELRWLHELQTQGREAEERKRASAARSSKPKRKH